MEDYISRAAYAAGWKYGIKHPDANEDKVDNKAFKSGDSHSFMAGYNDAQDPSIRNERLECHRKQISDAKALADEFQSNRECR